MLAKMVQWGLESKKNQWGEPPWYFCGSTASIARGHGGFASELSELRLQLSTKLQPSSRLSRVAATRAAPASPSPSAAAAPAAGRGSFRRGDEAKGRHASLAWFPHEIPGFPHEIPWLSPWNPRKCPWFLIFQGYKAIININKHVQFSHAAMRTEMIPASLRHKPKSCRQHWICWHMLVS